MSRASIVTLDAPKYAPDLSLDNGIMRHEDSTC